MSESLARGGINEEAGPSSWRQAAYQAKPRHGARQNGTQNLTLACLPPSPHMGHSRRQPRIRRAGWTEAPRPAERSCSWGGCRRLPCGSWDLSLCVLERWLNSENQFQNPSQSFFRFLPLFSSLPSRSLPPLSCLLQRHATTCRDLLPLLPLPPPSPPRRRRHTTLLLTSLYNRARQPGQRRARSLGCGPGRPRAAGPRAPLRGAPWLERWAGT